MSSPFPTQFESITPQASDNVLDRLAKLESRVLSAEQLFAPTGIVGNLTVTGNLSVVGTTMLIGTVTVTSYVESGFIFSHFVDALVNAAPVSAEVYHESSTGTPTAGNGASIDLSMDSDTVKRQVGARFTASWTTAADATRTAQLRLFLPNSGTLSQVLAVGPNLLGFYGVAAVARPLVPTGSTTDAVITALQSLGLFRQS